VFAGHAWQVKPWLPEPAANGVVEVTR